MRTIKLGKEYLFKHKSVWSSFRGRVILEEIENEPVYLLISTETGLVVDSYAHIKDIVQECWIDPCRIVTAIVLQATESQEKLAYKIESNQEDNYQLTIYKQKFGKLIIDKVKRITKLTKQELAEVIMLFSIFNIDQM